MYEAARSWTTWPNCSARARPSRRSGTSCAGCWSGSGPGQRFPPVLLQGDTGTGKGLVARLLHRHGPRSRGPFVDVNCAAIPETLLEAELFGFERGAFTDAHRAKAGLFQAAHGGVLFLDEVCLLPASLQAKLLTAIEERAVRRLGSTRAEPTDVWLISATNADLKAAVAARRFRGDLYHRLAVLTLDLPPLRGRGRDIVLLAERFLARACAEYGLPPRHLDPEAQARLLAHSLAREYPGAGECHRAGGAVRRHARPDGGRLGPLNEEGGEAGSLTRGLRPGRRRAGTRRCASTCWRRSRRWGGTSRTRRRGSGSRGTRCMRASRFGLALPTRPRKAAPEPDRAPVEPIRQPVPRARDIGLQWEERSVALLRADLGSAEGRGCLVTVQPGPGRSHRHRAQLRRPRGGGDATGLIAAFGLDPAEDAPRRAAHAALAIQRRCPARAQRWVPGSPSACTWRRS